jgi:hypothetical protein
MHARPKRNRRCRLQTEGSAPRTRCDGRGPPCMSCFVFILQPFSRLLPSHVFNRVFVPVSRGTGPQDGGGWTGSNKRLGCARPRRRASIYRSSQRTIPGTRPTHAPHQPDQAAQSVRLNIKSQKKTSPEFALHDTWAIFEGVGRGDGLSTGSPVACDVRGATRTKAGTRALKNDSITTRPTIRIQA